MRNILVMLLLLLTLSAWASSADYVFSVDSGTYTEIVGTHLIDESETNTTADGVNIGFDFIYNGEVYTQFGACSNGFLNIGDGTISTRSNDLSSSFYYPVIAALWDYQRVGYDTGEVSYALEGTAPNRILKVQFSEMYWYKSQDPVNLVNYQIWLYETTNNIEFHYGSFGTAPGSTASASIGMNMRQDGVTQFVSITPGSPATASTTTANNNIGQSDIGYFFDGMIYRLAYNPANQSINSVVVTQASTDGAELGSRNQQILRLDANTTNSGNPFSVNGLTFTSSGTLPDATAHIFYTGSSGTFSTSNQLGDAVSFTSTGESFGFTFSQELSNGSNNFWLAYDIPADYDYLNMTADAIATSIDIPGDTTPLTTPDPAGDRLVDDTTAPAINYSYLSSPFNTDDRTLSGVTITEAISMTVIPRMYYKKSANADAFGTYPGDNVATFDGWKYAEGTFAGSEWSFALDVDLINGGLTDGDVVEYFVVAQDDKPGTPNVASKPEGFVGTVAAPVTAPYFSATYNVILPLSGDYYVGPSETITSLYDFFDYAEARGIGGNTTVWITGDITEPDNAQLDTLTEYGAGGYTITFSPVPGTPATITGDFSGSLIIIDDQDNVVFDGGENKELSIAPAYYRGRCIEIKSGTENAIIRNCHLYNADDEPNTSAYGIYNTGGGVNDLLIENVDINHCGYGIYFSSSSLNYCQNITIQNSRIGSDDPSLYFLVDPIYMRYQNNVIISGNDIGGSLSDSWAPRGINLDYVTNVEITSNKIHDILYGGTSGMASGGILIGDLSGSNPNINIHNNMIWHFGGDCDHPTYAPSGIRLNGSSVGGISVCYNTVYLPFDDTYGMGSYDNDFTYSTGIMIDNGSGICPTGITMKNNIFDNRLGERTGNDLETYATAVYIRSTGTFTSPFSEISNNIYYTANADHNVIALHFDNDATYNWYNSLADWTTATGETGSLNVDPLYDDSDLLHLLDTSPAIGAGVTIPAITTDIDGDLRSDPPCIGADEREGFVLGAPTNITLTISGEWFTLSWSEVPGAIGYNIYWSDTPNGEYEFLWYTMGTWFMSSPGDTMKFFRVTATQ